MPSYAYPVPRLAVGRRHQGSRVIEVAVTAAGGNATVTPATAATVAALRCRDRRCVVGAQRSDGLDRRAYHRCDRCYIVGA